MTARFLCTPLLALALLTIGTPRAVHAQKKSRDVLTRDEILKSAQKDGDLYSAIKLLRPHMLETPRGVRSLGGSMGTAPLAVYVDKIRQPGADVLLQMMANTIDEVRYLDPSRSQNDYGITANGGALVIKKFVGTSVADSINALARKPPQ